MIPSSISYPDAQIDPRLKNFDWILQYFKAAWADSLNYMPSSMLFNTSINRFTEIKQYALGKQSVSKYKKVIAGDAMEDKTEVNNDSSVVAILPKYREIGISKLLQRQYDIEAAAIDPLSVSEEDKWFNEMKVKIMMREAMMQANPKLASSPVLQSQQNEPDDMEQLKMQAEFGYKHIMAMEAEEGIALVFGQNKQPQNRKETCESLFDFGIGGYKVWIDENGMVKFRACNGENLLTSYCVKSDYSDAVHIGEIIQVPVSDLAPYFNEGQLQNIAKNVAGKFGNPNKYDMNTYRWWDKFNVMVLDMQFFSWNTTVYKSEIDNRNNIRFGKTDFANIKYTMPDDKVTQNDLSGGEAFPKYIKNCKKVVYKGKWIIETEYMYDYGLKENQNRKLSSWWDVSLDYVLGSFNFYKMRFTGVTERLIPIADAYQLTWRKLQNLKNKLIPYLINLDLNALESVALGKGGQNMTPSQIVDFAFNNFILLYRSTDLLSNNPNYKPVSIEASGQLVAFAHLYQDLQFQIQQMRDISGLNELTDGSTPDAKTLTTIANLANTASNNALYLISECEKNLQLRLADLIVQKIQIAVKLGKVEGYAKALGSETVKFFQINPDVSLYEFGIFLRDAMTQEEKQQLYMEITAKEQQGLLDVSDRIFIQSCTNMKQAWVYLSYKVKKNKELMHQQQMQLVQQQTQGNMQVASATEQMKQQTIQIQTQGAAFIENIKGEWQWKIEMMKKQNDANEAHIQAQAKIISSQVQAKAKVDSTHIQSGINLLQTHMDNEANKEVAKQKQAS